MPGQRPCGLLFSIFLCQGFFNVRNEHTGSPSLSSISNRTRYLIPPTIGSGSGILRFFRSLNPKNIFASLGARTRNLLCQRPVPYHCAAGPPLILNKAKSIIADQSHALFCEFDVLPSGRRYRSVHGRTKRYIESFVPSVIRLLNRSSNSNGSI